MQRRSVDFPFDADLTDLILTTLTDIHSLESFVLSSKSVFNVFNTRRASVLSAVVSNHLGPATPSAIRLLKVMMDVHSYWHGWFSPLPIAKLPKEEYFYPNGSCVIVNIKEAHMLATNHDVIQGLESLYSWRKKDIRSRSSWLTPDESERFQTAMYRVWFVCVLYGRVAPANRVGNSKSKRFSEVLKGLGRAQAKFLQSFEPSQTGSLLEAWAFLVELAEWAVRAEYLPRKNHRSLEAYLVWSGPSTTLQAFQGKLKGIDKKVIPLLSASYEQFFEILNAASLSKEPRTGILTSPNECFLHSLKCQQCSHAPHEGLWNKSNWSYLRGIVPPSTFFEFLELPWWNSYTDAEDLEKICRTIPYSQLIEEVFTIRSKAYEAWKPGHWLCRICLGSFMQDNMEAFCRSQGQTEHFN